MTQYVIKAGDTFYAIAKAHGITVDALVAANPGVNPSNLQVGQKINLPSKPGGSNGGGAGNEAGKGYVNYSGPASHFPPPSQWAPYATLVQQNKRLMKFHDTDAEIDLILKAVDKVSHESGISASAILCTIVQESGGNPRVNSTNNGVHNPGLMQSHNGAAFNPKDPAGSILQMVRDGTEGTRDGDGLKQLYKKYGNYYEAFRGYNSGTVNHNDLNDPVGATASYVRDMANRLMGHVWNNM